MAATRMHDDGIAVDVNALLRLQERAHAAVEIQDMILILLLQNRTHLLLLV